MYNMIKSYLISSTVNWIWRNFETSRSISHGGIAIRRDDYPPCSWYCRVFPPWRGTKVEQLSTLRISDRVQREGTRVNNEFSIVLQCTAAEYFSIDVSMREWKAMNLMLVSDWKIVHKKKKIYFHLEKRKRLTGNMFILYIS